MVKNKNVLFLTGISIFACGLHAAMLQAPFNNYLYSSVLKIILFILCPAIYFMISEDGKFQDLFITKADKKYTKIAFAVALCVFAFILLLYMMLRPFLDHAMIIDALEKNKITGNNFAFVFLYVVLINAALEELFFRGFIFKTIYRMNYKCFAQVFSSLMFALYHVAILNGAISPGILILCITGLAASGLIFNYAVIKCKSITGSLILHISANLALNLIVVGYYFLNG